MLYSIKLITLLNLANSFVILYYSPLKEKVFAVMFQHFLYNTLNDKTMQKIFE